MPDDGSDGVFWRAGERWIRVKGEVFRMQDRWGELEDMALMNILVMPGDKLEIAAHAASLSPN